MDPPVLQGRAARRMKRVATGQELPGKAPEEALFLCGSQNVSYMQHGRFVKSPSCGSGCGLVYLRAEWWRRR